MMELIDEADLGAADAGALGVRQPEVATPSMIDFAAVGLLKQSRDVQQRRFSGAGWRDQRHRLARPNAQARRL